MNCGSPNVIEVLLHYHVSPLDHPREDAPAVREAVNYLIKEGLLQNDGHGAINTTAKGKFHVESLCELAFPIQKWVRG